MKSIINSNNTVKIRILILLALLCTLVQKTSGQGLAIDPTQSVSAADVEVTEVPTVWNGHSVRTALEIPIRALIACTVGVLAHHRQGLPYLISDSQHAVISRRQPRLASCLLSSKKKTIISVTSKDSTLVYTIQLYPGLNSVEPTSDENTSMRS